MLAHRLGHRLGQLAEGPNAPADATQAELVEQLPLGQVRRQPAHGVRQGRRGHGSHNPQLDFQREQTAAAGLQRLIAESLQGNGAEQAVQVPQRRLRSQTIILTFPRQLWRHLAPMLRLQVIDGPLEDSPPDFPQQVLQLCFELKRGLWRHGTPTKAGHQPYHPQHDRPHLDQQVPAGPIGQDCQQTQTSGSILHRGVPMCDCSSSKPQLVRGTPFLPISIANSRYELVRIQTDSPSFFGAERTAPPHVELNELRKMAQKRLSTVLQNASSSTLETLRSNK
jgi:hypothetical protein